MYELIFIKRNTRRISQKQMGLAVYKALHGNAVERLEDVTLLRVCLSV